MDHDCSTELHKVIALISSNFACFLFFFAMKKNLFFFSIYAAEIRGVCCVSVDRATVSIHLNKNLFKVYNIRP